MDLPFAGLNMRYWLMMNCTKNQAKKTLKQLEEMGHKPLPSIDQFTILFAKVICTC